MSENMMPVRRSNLLAQNVLEEMVLYDSESEMGYSLNASAKAIWDCCDGSRTVLQISDDLSASLDIPADLLIDDVRQALEQLLMLGLIRDNRAAVGGDEHGA